MKARISIHEDSMRGDCEQRAALTNTTYTVTVRHVVLGLSSGSAHIYRRSDLGSLYDDGRCTAHIVVCAACMITHHDALCVARLTCMARVAYGRVPGLYAGRSGERARSSGRWSPRLSAFGTCAGGQLRSPPVRAAMDEGPDPVIEEVGDGKRLVQPRGLACTR